MSNNVDELCKTGTEQKKYRFLNSPLYTNTKSPTRGLDTSIVLLWSTCGLIDVNNLHCHSTIMVTAIEYSAKFPVLNVAVREARQMVPPSHCDTLVPDRNKVRFSLLFLIWHPLIALKRLLVVSTISQHVRMFREHLCILKVFSTKRFSVWDHLHRHQMLDVWMQCYWVRVMKEPALMWLLIWNNV